MAHYLVSMNNFQLDVYTSEGLREEAEIGDKCTERNKWKVNTKRVGKKLFSTVTNSLKCWTTECSYTQIMIFEQKVMCVVCVIQLATKQER